MSRFSWLILIPLLLVVSCICGYAGTQIPTVFVENQGQWDESVSYVVRGPQGTAVFTDSGVSVVMQTRDRGSPKRIRASFPGSLDRFRIDAIDRLPGTINYFNGSGSYTEIRTYAGIVYRNVWHGVDIAYKTECSRLKYDIIVDPFADIGCIRIKYDGVDRIYTDDSGCLHILAGAVRMVEEIPAIYQLRNGHKELLQGGFILHEDGSIGFTVKYRDPSLQLIIDPASNLTWGSFIGGSGQDFAYSVASDSSGNVYIAGGTESLDLLAVGYDANYNGGRDAFVAKLNDSGTSLVYCTFIGGSDTDEAWDIAVDSVGCAYVTGHTYSSNFPVTTGSYDTSYNAGPQDVFVLKLNSTGSSLDYSTFLGGTGIDLGNGIAVDSSGCAYVVGETYSNDYPTTAGAFDTSLNLGTTDAFVTKLNSFGSSLVYSTFLGGGKTDSALDVAVDTNGSAYVTGGTYSSTFPKTVGAYDTSYNGQMDVFVSRINPTGSGLMYSTFLGGVNNDMAYSIALDSSGRAYIAGEAGIGFPTTSNACDPSFNGGETDAFIARINASGSLLDFATFIGSSGRDIARCITLGSDGTVYISGDTDSASFPVSANAFDSTFGGYNESFLIKLDDAGSTLLHSTFTGGNGSENAYGIALGSSSSVYTAGQTWSLDFLTKPGSYDQSYNGLGDAFVLKIDMHYENPFNVTPSIAKATADGTYVQCLSIPVTAAFDSYFYIQDQLSGIRVYRPGHNLAVGTLVNVKGTLDTMPSGERVIIATEVW